ncbi:MAG: exo-alpha-sialidase [Paenibacillaceae bacterium]|nr:exo-alpha-sialidase [Paenibacillaceae bacterium]
MIQFTRRHVLHLLLAFALLIAPVAGIGIRPAAVHADSSDAFETDTIGTAPDGYSVTNSDANAQASISGTYAFDGSQSLRLYDNSAATYAAIVKTFAAQSSAMLDFHLYPVAVGQAVQFSLFSGGNAPTDAVIHLKVSPDGGLHYYNGSAWVSISGAGTVAFNAWNAIRVVAANTTSASVYVGGVLKGTAGKYKTASTFDRIRFGTGGSSSTGDDYYVDAVSITGAPVSGQTYDTFEADTTGTTPAGYTVANSDANANAAVSDAYAYDGMRSLRVYDNSTATYAAIVKTVTPSSALSFEFKLYPVAAAGAIQFGLFSGGNAATDAVFHLKAAADGSLHYYNGSSWVSLSGAGSVPFNAWSTVRVDAANTTTASVYVNGALKGTAPKWKTSSTVDRIRFATGGSASTGDDYYVDGVNIVGVSPTPTPTPTPTATPSPFRDTFEADTAGTVPANYTVVSSDANAGALVSAAQASEGAQSLRISDQSTAVAATVARTFGAVGAAKLQFDLYPVSAGSTGAIVFGLSNGGNTDAEAVYNIKLTANGSLYFLRGGLWYMIAGPGTVAYNAWSAVTLNVTNPSYADLYVNGTFVGGLRANAAAVSFDRLRFTTGGTTTTGDVYYVDDVDLGTADPLAPMPTYSPVPITAYSPTILTATVGYLDNDTSPLTGAVGNWGYTGAVALDYQQRSIGVDLGSTQRVHAIRLQDSDVTARPVQERYAVYASNDNVTYTPVNGALLNSSTVGGKRIHFLEFSGVTARYVKVTTTYTDTGWSLQLSNLQTMVQVQQRPVREYRLPATAGKKDNDTSPASGALTFGVVPAASMLDYQSRSIGIDLGLSVPTDALELWDTDASTRIGAGDLVVYESDDNVTFTTVSSVSYSTRTEGGRGVIRLDFPSVTAKFFKVTTSYNDTSATFQMSNIQQDIRVFSSTEAASGFEFFNDARGADGGFFALNDGSLLMGYNEFSGAGDTSSSYIAARKSTDGGYTWGAPFTLLANEGVLNTTKPTFLRMTNGNLGMFYQVQESTSNCVLYFRQSADEGATWGSRTLITAFPSGYHISPSGMRILRLPSGRIIVPAAWSVNATGATNGSDQMSAHVWYSDDEGATWKRSPGWVYLPHGALEPVVARLNNGDLIMTLRTRIEGKMYKAISTDDGITWSQPVEIGLPTPSSNNIVTIIPATGDLLLAWNNVFSTTNTPRTPLTFAISRDNGTTWNVVRNVMEGENNADNSAWPVVAFYGREVILQFGHSSTNATAVRIMDIDTLYYNAKQ